MFALSSFVTQANVFEGFKSGLSDAGKWIKKNPEIVAPLAASAAVGLAGGAAHKWKKSRPAQSDIVTVEEGIVVSEPLSPAASKPVMFPQGAVGSWGAGVYQPQQQTEQEYKNIDNALNRWGKLVGQ